MVLRVLTIVVGNLMDSTFGATIDNPWKLREVLSIVSHHNHSRMLFRQGAKEAHDAFSCLAI